MSCSERPQAGSFESCFDFIFVGGLESHRQHGGGSARLPPTACICCCLRLFAVVRPLDSLSGTRGSVDRGFVMVGFVEVVAVVAVGVARVALIYIDRWDSCDGGLCTGRVRSSSCRCVCVAFIWSLWLSGRVRRSVLGRSRALNWLLGSRPALFCSRKTHAECKSLRELESRGRSSVLNRALGALHDFKATPSARFSTSATSIWHSGVAFSIIYPLYTPPVIN
jgi:hypothetical protein